MVDHTSMSSIRANLLTLLTPLDSIMVRAQMLAELEEIISFKQYADQPERQEMMKKTWMKR